MTARIRRNAPHANPRTQIKRRLDVLLACCALIVGAPLMALIAMAIRVTLGSPILFRQQRPGLHGVPFELIKFRTMHDANGPDGQPLPVNQRITRLGYLLRRTSLDELPELINILRGEMSFVGPRPLLMEYLPRYSAEQMRRHDVTPGLTGLAQVSGRHLLEWEKRFTLDVWYVDHWSLRLDLRIISATVSAVLGGRGLGPRDAGDYMFTGSESDQE